MYSALCSLKTKALKYLLLLLVIPLSLQAQVVEPVISADYAAQVKKLKSETSLIDSITYARNRLLKLDRAFSWYSPVKSVKRIGKDSVSISAYAPLIMYLSGSYSATADVKRLNRLPYLQNEFVQGRAENGVLQWRGAETGELFSYGPALGMLEFDGSTYNYDNKGKLVAKGSGNGQPAAAYDNNIIKNAVVFSQYFSLSGDIRRYGDRKLNFGVKLGNTNENTVIRDNYNTIRQFSADAGANLRRFRLKGNYGRIVHDFSNSNRSGFLNSVYQNALLTPVSFSNKQGAYLGSGQRSYSNQANNPLFLLRDNNNRYRWVQQTGAFTAGYSNGRFQVNTIQSLLDVRQQDKEVYKPGTAFRPDGMYTDRNKHTYNYQLKSDLFYRLNKAYHYAASFEGSYLFYKEMSDISYMPDNTRYNYRRTSNEASLQASLQHNPYGVDITLNAGNRFYQSTTTLGGPKFFQPSVSFKMDVRELVNNLQLKMAASWMRLNSELPLNQSMSYYNLLQYTPDQALQYRPVAEVASYQQLQPIEHTEYTGNVELVYKYRYSLRANVYLRNTRGDVFPVNNSGQLVLQNLANIRKKGIEVILSLPAAYSGKKVWRFANTLSFNSYRNIVTDLKGGGKVLPTGGFSNVFTALVKDAPVGVVMGNDYVRDEAGKTVIGEDGFPLAGTQYTIVANPNPDFVIKTSNTIWWKSWSLGLDWEWKKGGTGWNGTQAALDFYGRSAGTATGRNITGYVFSGVWQNGHVNDIPVRFYDVTQPLEKSRWVRYGLSGVATDYIQHTDYVRLNDVQLSYKLAIGTRKDAVMLGIHLYNLLLWTPYQGSGFSQLLYDQPNTSGLDFFNLPAATTYGFSASLQF